MLNQLHFIPDRQKKPRSTGFSMVMDKGLSLRQAYDLVETAGHITDFVKLGFGTSLVSNKVKEKVRIYRAAGIHVFAGGTLFEAFWIRNQLKLYTDFINSLSLDAVEISDGSVCMAHEEKCELISKFSGNYIVLSEVGRKDCNDIMENDVWVTEMQKELLAGSRLVIAEARESGTAGVYDSSGNPDESLIADISKGVDVTKIMWEAPVKSQQAWLIKRFGYDVNLGNIPPEEMVALETLRIGLRGDTFFDFIPHNLNLKK